MRLLFLLLLSALTALRVSAADDLFKPVRSVDLRAPSVPLITSDPYFSIWSPYDKLTDGNTEHWTADEHPIMGAIRVDGKTYRFMGKDRQVYEAILPMTDDEAWEGRFLMDRAPEENWYELDYNDGHWNIGKAAFGTSENKRIKTKWSKENSDIWIRREFVMDSLDEDVPLLLKYSHDDVTEIYLNGNLLVSTGNTWRNDVWKELSVAEKQMLRKGKNVIAVHCHNTVHGAYLDFGLYRKGDSVCRFDNEAHQKSVDVLPTQTYYTFECGPVELDLVFTAPLLMDDLDLISTPINYISYRVRPLDKKQHDVQVYFETSPLLAVHEVSQPVKSEAFAKNGMDYLRAGTVDQAYTARKGDIVRIDWGYVYLASAKGIGKKTALGTYYGLKRSFLDEGTISPEFYSLESTGQQTMPVMAYTDNLGKVDVDGKSGFLMLGYDDVYALEYFYKRRQAYWKHDGRVDIFTAFERAHTDYASRMERCRAFDLELMNEAEKAGGKEYAELLALVYRQTIAAHKLFTDDDGNVLFFSKENNSNGCVNTVDITYPSAPLFLVYNPELLKGMMRSIFYYSESGRWKKPYPTHDLGTYPIANGVVYGGDMPIEEAGNMVILATAISLRENNAAFAAQHWQTLTTWTNYLAEYGLDPENQVCTDDFAGHWAHNVNLSVKAIVAIAGYAEMARMLGYDSVADEFGQKARDMATEWEKMAFDGDHYRLAFDKPGTWSQKYNMVWDKVFGWNLFPAKVAETEMKFYHGKMNAYGLPLDSRETYSKNDWIMWTACLGTQDDFLKFVHTVYKYADETSSRVPLSDWYDTKSANMMSFKARSVVGGFYMKLLMERLNLKK